MPKRIVTILIVTTILAFPTLACAQSPEQQTQPQLFPPPPERAATNASPGNATQARALARREASQATPVPSAASTLPHIPTPLRLNRPFAETPEAKALPYPAAGVFIVDMAPYTEEAAAALEQAIAAKAARRAFAEEQRQREEAERQRLAEEQRQREEAERQRLAEEQQKREEAERQRLAEEQQKREEAERQRLAEEQQKREEAERQRLAEEQQKREEAERQRLAEEQQKREEAERQRLAEEQQKREEAERQRLAEEQQKAEAKPAPPAPPQPKPTATSRRPGKPLETAPEVLADPKAAKALEQFRHFAVEWLAKNNRAYVQGTAAKPKVTKQGQGYVATYMESLPNSLETLVKPSEYSHTPFIGVMRYEEKLYRCEGPTAEAARQAPCSEVDSTRITEIFRYAKNKWQF